jgi:hypothetical protein
MRMRVAAVPHAQARFVGSSRPVRFALSENRQIDLSSRFVTLLAARRLLRDVEHEEQRVSLN